MKMNVFHQRWFQILASGILLFIVTVWALTTTGNPALIPIVIVIGAFLVPVTFVTYFYEHVRDRDISMPLLSTCFLVGGLFGLIAAGLIEYSTLHNMGISSLLGVGLIEETVKLAFPILMFVGWKYRHEADGLLFGVAAGMGFAALETMGYALAVLIQTRGDVVALQQVLLIRGLLSPAGHAAWTGFVCAVLWRERERTGRILSLAVVGAYILAIFLHGLWDAVNSLDSTTGVSIVVPALGSLVIIIASLVLIIRRFREARNQ